MIKQLFPLAILWPAIALSTLASAATVTLTDTKMVTLNPTGSLSFGVYEAASGSGTASFSSFTGEPSISQAFSLNLGSLSLPADAVISAATLTLTAQIGNSSLAVGDAVLSDVRNQRSWQIVGWGCGYWGTPCWDTWGWVDSTTPGVGGSAGFVLASTAAFSGSNIPAMATLVPTAGGVFDIAGGLPAAGQDIHLSGDLGALLTPNVVDYGYFATTNYQVSGQVPFEVAGRLQVDYTSQTAAVPEPVSSSLMLAGLLAVALLRMRRGR